MGKKKFEELLAYDPIEDQAQRDAAKVVAKDSSGKLKASNHPIVDIDNSLHVVEGRKAKPKSPKINPLPIVAKKAKSRSFMTAGPQHDLDLDAFIVRMKQMSGTNVSFNVLSRAAIEAMVRVEEQIIEEIRKTPPPSQPATSNHDGYVEFEEYWVTVIAKALRKLRPMQ